MTPPRSQSAKRPPAPRVLPPIVRDVVILLAGVVGFLHELMVHQGPERPLFIFGSLAALGLPVALRADKPS